MKPADMVDIFLDGKGNTMRIAEGCVDVILDEMSGIIRDPIDEDSLEEADWGYKAYKMAKSYLAKRKASKADKKKPGLIKRLLTTKGGVLGAVSKRNAALAASAKG